MISFLESIGSTNESVRRFPFNSNACLMDSIHPKMECSRTLLSKPDLSVLRSIFQDNDGGQSGYVPD